MEMKTLIQYTLEQPLNLLLTFNVTVSEHQNK